MVHLNNKVLDALGTLPSVKSPEELVNESGYLIESRLGLNENPFPLPSKIKEEIYNSLESLGLYGDPLCHELSQQISQKCKVSPDSIAVDAGIDSIVMNLCHLILKPDDTVLMMDGTHPMCRRYSTISQARIHFLHYENATVPLQQLAEKATEIKPQMVYLANPDNPSGTFFNPEELQAFIDKVTRHSILILDEAYVDYVPQERRLPYESGNPNLIRLRTFSKLYGLAGLRVGYAIANPRMIHWYQQVRTHFGVCKLAQQAASICLRHDGYDGEMLRVHEESKKSFLNVMNERGISAHGPETNFVLIDLKNQTLRDKIYKHILAAGVYTLAMKAKGLTHLLRVSVGEVKDMMNCAAKISEALASI